jgi:hypothetical protein
MRDYLIIGTFSAVTLFGAYGKFWEYKQPERTIKAAKILSIKPYVYRNEILPTSFGNIVKTDKEDAPIDFKIDKWNKNVKEGDEINLVVKKKFSPFGVFGDELDGLKIE